ncbi:MAG TPA: glycosyltransferase, partial [Thermoanaerobaculia bacterium]|nr:glycosyltransferase [Thermoanaerobaculia bacterium]
MTASDELVSIIVPVWRPRRKWLTAAISSALCQVGCSVEVVVVDDGNEVPVRELLADFEDARLRVVERFNGGASAARNSGIAAARGAWIRFHDSDDVLEPDSTRHLLDLASGGDPTIAYGATVLCGERLEPRSKTRCEVQGRSAERCLLGQLDVYHQAMLFPVSVVEKTGPWDEALPVGNDWDFVLRALDHAPVRGDARIVFRYRMHEGSLTRDGEAWERVFPRIVEKYFDRHPQGRGTRLHRHARARVLMFRLG